MPFVEAFDPGDGSRQQAVVFGHGFRGRIEPVGQQGEADVPVGIGQVVDLEPADAFLDVRRASQQGRHHDQRAKVARDAVVQLEPWQRPRTEHGGHAPIDQRDREVRGRPEPQDRDEHERQVSAPTAPFERQDDRHGEDQDREQREAPEIGGSGRPQVRPAQTDRRRKPDPEGLLEGRSAVRDQEVARIAGGRRPGQIADRRLRDGRVPGRRRTRHGHGGAGDLEFGGPGVAGDFLDRVAVPVPGREIHLGKAVPAAQGLVDEADALDELRPVEPRDQAHARDHVPDGHVHRGLPLVLQADGLLGRGALRRQELLEALECRRHGRVLVAQSLEELDHAGRRQLRPGEPAQGRARGLGFPGTEAEEAVRKFVRLLASDPAGDDLLGQASQVLDEQDAQSDGDGPQLAEGQRLHPLVRGDQTTEAVGVEAAVGVGDVGPRQAEDARIALERAVRELGELPVVARRQVIPDLAELLLDDVEVVDQPLRRRGDGPFVLDRLGEGAVGREQDPAVVRDPTPDRVPGPRPMRDRLGGGERRPVLLEAFHAEQLGDDRFRCVDLAAGRAQDRDGDLP